MSDNGQYYIALTLYDFNYYICNWLGTVQNCYILRASSVDSSFDTSTSISLFPVIYESDEEEEK